MNHPFFIALTFFFCLPFLNEPLNAQESEEGADSSKHWSTRGNFTLNFSQVALRNWTGGGESSLSGTGEIEWFLTYEKQKNHWENRMDLRYGLLKQESVENFRKSDDEWSFQTKYNRALNDYINLSGFLNFNTSITKGYNYPGDDQDRVLISDFMAPGYLQASLGAAYSPNEGVSINLSPLTGKSTFVLNDTLSEQGRYGVEPGKTFKQEFGSNLRISLKGEPFKNVFYKTHANFFSSYQNPAEIDVNWEAKIKFRINDFLVTTIHTNLIYDEDINVTRDDGSVGPAVQFKEVFALGIDYTL